MTNGFYATAPSTQTRIHITSTSMCRQSATYQQAGARAVTKPVAALPSLYGAAAGEEEGTPAHQATLGTGAAATELQLGWVGVDEPLPTASLPAAEPCQ